MEKKREAEREKKMMGLGSYENPFVCLKRCLTFSQLAAKALEQRDLLGPGGRKLSKLSTVEKHLQIKLTYPNIKNKSPTMLIHNPELPFRRVEKISRVQSEREHLQN